MNDLVGIIRNGNELAAALERLEQFKQRVARVSVTGGRAFNPGWHLALDLQNLLLVSECLARSALMREESRGGHTRDDFPAMSPQWRQVSLICRMADGRIDVSKQSTPTIPSELLSLFDVSELQKYFTEAELTGVAGGSQA